MAMKDSSSRFILKEGELGLSQEENAKSIKLMWDKNKLAKLQYFMWQINLGGLLSGSWAALAGFPGNCLDCNARISETLEHLLYDCRFAQRIRRRVGDVRRVLDLSRQVS